MNPELRTGREHLDGWKVLVNDEPVAALYFKGYWMDPPGFVFEVRPGTRWEKFRNLFESSARRDPDEKITLVNLKDNSISIPDGYFVTSITVNEKSKDELLLRDFRPVVQPKSFASLRLFFHIFWKRVANPFKSK